MRPHLSLAFASQFFHSLCLSLSPSNSSAPFRACRKTERRKMIQPHYVIINSFQIQRSDRYRLQLTLISRLILKMVAASTRRKSVSDKGANWKMSLLLHFTHVYRVPRFLPLRVFRFPLFIIVGRKTKKNSLMTFHIVSFGCRAQFMKIMNESK